MKTVRFSVVLWFLFLSFFIPHYGTLFAENSSSAENAISSEFPAWLSLSPAEEPAKKWFSASEKPRWEIPAASRCSLRVRTGAGFPDKKACVTFTLCWSDGKETRVGIRPSEISHTLMTDFNGKKKGEKIDLPDAVLILTRPGNILTYHVRPNLRRFHSASTPVPQYSELLQLWNQLPAASEHTLKFKLYSKSSGSADLYLDGSYIQTIPAPENADSHVEKLIAEPGPNAYVAEGEELTTDAAFYALDLSANPKPRAFAQNARLEGVPDTGKMVFRKLGAEQIPAWLVNANLASDVGICRQGQGNWALEVDEYLMRTPCDAFPSAIHYRVPARPYFRAWVALALDDTPLNPPKENILTVRLTKYFSDPGVGNSFLADTTVRLEPDLLEKYRVPDLQITRSGKPALAVYWVPVTLDVGKILDLAAGRSWRDLPESTDFEPTFLDVEFFGKPYESFHQTDERSKPDPKSVSAVQILAATLETAPAGIDVVEKRPGNVFLEGENAEMNVRVRPYPSAHPETPNILRYTVRDFEGKVLQEREIPLETTSKTASDTAFSVSESRTEIYTEALEQLVIPLNFPVGFYWLDLSCAPKTPGTGEASAFYTMRASFSILPQDERRAGYESPYGLWWFRNVHFVPGDNDFVGTLMNRCGARSAFYSNEPQANLEKYKIGKRQITLGPAGNFRMLTEDGTDVKPELYTAVDAWMKSNLEKFPSIQEVCIFHESGPGADYPYELWGEKQVWNEGQEARHRRYGVMLSKVSAYMKEHYPSLRLVVGNNTSSMNTIGAVTRWGLGTEYLDAIGTEVTGQQAPPEKPSDMTPVIIHATQEIGRIFAGKTFPGNSCYESTSRTERTLGYKKQAQWYTRDALIALSNGYTTVGNGEIIDPGNCYHNTLWGDAGLLHRGPYCFPKPAYQSFAVLTNVLDTARVSRRLPTGSATVYAMQFERTSRKTGEGTLAYAFWCARGEGKLRLTPDSAGTSFTARFIGMFGTEKKLTVKPSETLEIPFSESPCYIITDVPFTAAAISERKFSEDTARAAAARTVCTLESADGLRVSEDASLDTRFEGQNVEWPARRRGDFSLKTVSDPEMGACVEVTLNAEIAEKNTAENNAENIVKNTAKNNVKYTAETTRPADLITKYVRIEIPESETVKFPVPEHGLGVWVRGNSNWGRLMFELEDEQGRVLRSTGVGGWGCDSYDWPGFMSVNFDGWTFIALPTRVSGAFDVWGPGQAASNWNGAGQESLLRKDAVFKLKAIYVEMNRQTLGLTGIESVKDLSIRMKNFSAF